MVPRPPRPPSRRQGSAAGDGNCRGDLATSRIRPCAACRFSTHAFALDASQKVPTRCCARAVSSRSNASAGAPRTPPNPPLPGFLSPLIVSESSLGKRRKVQTLSYIAASRRHPRALDERSALPAPGADLRNTKSNGVWSEHHTLPDYRALNQTRRCKGAVAIVFASPPDVPVESRLGPAPLSGQSSVPTAHACT